MTSAGPGLPVGPGAAAPGAAALDSGGPGGTPARRGGLALLPLDERPVNTRLPRDVAAVAGVDLALPPSELLPRRRVPGDVDGLAGWLRSVAGAGSIGVCLDTLVHGGLIAARTSDDQVEACLRRLSVLGELADRRPRPVLDAVAVVTRAADSDDAGEEPAYWSDYGRSLHRMGVLLHERFEADGGSGPEPTGTAYGAGRASGGPRSGSPELDDVVRQVPGAIRRDFAHRRLRNHIVNLRAVDLLSEGVLDTLLITADDTARYSAGSAEQRWIRHWARALGVAGPREALLMYPGADEVGCTLVARGLHRLAGCGPADRVDAAGVRRPVRIAVASADGAGMARVPLFENAPLAVSVPRQIRAAGAEVVAAPGRDMRAGSGGLSAAGGEGGSGSGRAGDPDVVLVVHPAAEQPLDATVDALPHAIMGGASGAVRATGAAGATANLVGRALEGGVPVVVADARYANGADPVLVDELAGLGLLGRLAGYAGWNTAGNTVGSAVAVAVAVTIGDRLGTGSAQARRRLLVHRLLEDDVYQGRARRAIREDLGLASTGTPFGPGQEERAVAMATGLLEEGLARLGFDGWRIHGVRFPWHRTFEIDFDLVTGRSGR